MEVRSIQCIKETHTNSSVFGSLSKFPTRVLTSQDVQSMKDDVPVIYHDFLISERRIDAPQHNLYLDQVIYKPF